MHLLQSVRKSTPPKNQGLKALGFGSCLMKENTEMIHFHIKSRVVQDYAFVQITFGKYTTNVYFEKGKSGIKNNNFQFVDLISIKRFHMFLRFSVASFSIKMCFYKTGNIFYLR